MRTPICQLLLAFCFSAGYGQQTDFNHGGLQDVPSKKLASRAFSNATMFDGTQPFDVLHYKLDLTLAMLTEDFRGESAITMVVRSPLDSIVLNSLSLDLDTIRVDGDRKSAVFDNLAETCTIFLGGQRNPGDTLHITVSYRRRAEVPRSGSRKGYYFFHDLAGLPANLGYTMSEPSDARLWMPCFDEPWDKATAEINVTVPFGFVAASNGKLLGVTPNGDTTLTWRWREDHQIATYLMCVTASRFSVLTSRFVRAAGDTIPVQYFVWPEDSVQCAAFLPTVADMIGSLSGLFGPYPFDKYGMSGVVPFAFGGMEHQTITTLNRFRETDELVVVHELAHQWWGDLVTCASWPDIWLNESFATYSEALWRESKGGGGALRGFMKSELEHFFFGSWEGAVYDPVGQGFNLFDDVVYSKGAWVLHVLRGVLGDTKFFNALHAYRQTFAGKSATTTEFQSVVESVEGMDMNWFFREWIFSPGWPAYSLRWRWSNDVLSCEVKQTQRSAWQTYTMPVEIRSYNHLGGTTSFIVRDSLRTQNFSLPLPFVPDSVSFDPDGWILKESGVIDPSSGFTLSFRLAQNYPNPFNGGTTIQYSIPSTEHVVLRVYDLLGREVATLVDGVQAAGEYAVPFPSAANKPDGTTPASGMYICRLQWGGSSAVRKMLLLH